MTTKPPTSKALAARMAEGSKPGKPTTGERAALDFGHRVTLDLSEPLYSALREACYRAGSPSLPQT